LANANTEIKNVLPGRSNLWLDFWHSENIFEPFQWEKNTEIFVRGSEEILDYKPTDRVLDIGCGPGTLEYHLKGRVGEICGVDISAGYVEGCREKFRDCPSLSFRQMGENYLDFSFLGTERKFDKIICHGVVQYYHGLHEVESLIREVRALANPGARFLISDIPLAGGRSSFIAAFLKKSYQEGFLWDLVKFTWRAYRSSYYTAFRSQGLIQVRREDLIALKASLGVEGRLLENPLSLSMHRIHLLIEF